MRILMVCSVVVALANAASGITTAYSGDWNETKLIGRVAVERCLDEHENGGVEYWHCAAQAALGDEYGERCSEYADLDECLMAFSGDGGE
jgi:hypothetical protein